VNELGGPRGIFAGILIAAGVVACGGSTFTTSPGDAGGDSPTSDGSLDEAADGGCPVPDASWCTTRSGTFCDDFDEDEAGAVIAGWDMPPTIIGPGQLTIASTFCPPSPPNALSANLSGAGAAALTKSFSFGSKTSLTLELRVRQGLHFDTGGLDVIAVVGVGVGGGVSIVLTANAIAVVAKPTMDAGIVPGDSGISGNDAGVAVVGTAPLPAPGEWKLLRLVVTASTITALENENFTQFAQGPTPFAFGSPANVSIGSYATNAKGEVDFDNVSFDVR
jgi:hypothetical protein